MLLHWVVSWLCCLASSEVWLKTGGKTSVRERISAMDFIAHLLSAREACGDDYPRETHNRRSILFDPISPKECLNYSFFEGILRSTCLLLRGIETRFSFLGN